MLFNGLKRVRMKLKTLCVYSAAALVLLSGCDTGDGTGGNAPAKGNVNGLVVVPKVAETNATISCGQVPIPGGYLPLAGAEVDFLDANGSVALTQTTDSCGRFYGNVDTQGLTMVEVNKAGYHTMLSDISAFNNGGDGWGIVSTADLNNSFAVRVNSDGNSVTYDAKTGNFKYSVMDTKSQRAVLGIPQSQVTVYKDKTRQDMTAYLFNNLDADLVLTLDASGSMDYGTYGDNNQSGFDLVYDVSKSFIDELSGNAKLGINIFDDKIDFINQSFVDSLNLDGKFIYAQDGFERDKTHSKFIIDIYHPHSHVYDANSTLVPEYPYMTAEEYKWGGATAYIDAASKAVAKLDSRGANEKIAVLMTDGGDNSSQKTIKDVINEALQSDVIFYTISMGEYTDPRLKALAEVTGGSYIRANGEDISDKFAEVLSDVQYYYEVGTAIEENTTAYYRVDVKLDGETVSGLIDFNSTVTVPDINDTNQTRETGAQLYTKCMPCHGVYGEVSAYGVSAVINEMDTATLYAALSKYKAGTLDLYGYGDIMNAQVSTMSDEELMTLSEYIPMLSVPETNTTAPDVNTTQP